MTKDAELQDLRSELARLRGLKREAGDPAERADLREEIEGVLDEIDLLEHEDDPEEA
jgi:hypothetical protein